MEEYLYIKDFGPIKEVELNDIRPFTILIGESGSGKSTIMKVLSLFRWIYKRVNLRSYLKHAQIKKTRIGFKIKSLMKTSGVSDFLRSESLIIYRRGNYEIKMANKQVRIAVDVAPENLCLDKICFISDKRSMIPNFLEHRMEGRIANYYLQDTVDNFLLASEVIKSFKMDYLGVQFKVEKMKNGMIKYKIVGDVDDDFSIEFKNASSGIQTVTPLALITEYFATHFDTKESMTKSLFSYMMDAENLKNFSTAREIGDIQNRNVHIFIEEPELSLYPESQKSLIDFLVDRCFTKPHGYNMTLMLATHSPYILNYVNLLVERYEKERNTPFKIAFNDVNAYELVDGYAYDLKLVGQHKLVNTASLSEPINEIYAEYNKEV